MWQVSHPTVPPAAAGNLSAETHITVRLINVPHTCERSGWKYGPRPLALQTLWVLSPL